VDATTAPDEQALRAQLGRARARLDGLVRDLRGIDGELEGLSGERERHQLLGRACEALEQLGALGAASLFWGEGASGEVARLRDARARVEAFEKRFAEIEERRQGVFEELLQQQEGTELLEDDVIEIEREKAERELDWPIEREVGPLPVGTIALPWSHGGEDDVRFRKNLAASLLFSIAFSLVVPRIPLPAPAPFTPADVPERVTRLIQKARIAERQPKPRESEPVTAKETQRVAEAKPKAAPKVPTQTEGPGAGVADGAGSGPKGFLAFRERLAGVAARDVAANLGLNARLGSVGDMASGRPTRSLVTTNAPGSGAGVQLAAVSRGLGSGGGQALGGVAVARVTSAIAGNGGGSARSGTSSLGGGPMLGRTDEEIQIVFDRHKAALYRLYNRELRVDPALKGQIVLRIKIEPDGSVSLCVLQTTDMQAPQLAAQVVDRVRAFDFGAKQGIAAVTILYPIEFLPAT
jgi:hypothetical protein